MKALLFLAAGLACGQTASQPPRYDVSAIRPASKNDLRSGGYSFHLAPDGSIAAAGITLRRLMMTAYNIQGFRIVGGPGWVSSRRWNLRAKPDSAATDNQIRPMLRVLLEDRFQLRTHSEIRKLPVYELVVDRNEPRVPMAKDSTSKPKIRVASGSIQLVNMTSATFAGQLSYSLARPVIDKTNMKGHFDFTLTWTPEPGEDGGPTTSGLPPGFRDAAGSTQDGPSIFTAIRTQLGLRLKSTHGPVQVLVIDGAQLPGSN